jgi:hypothetical protein
MRLGKRNTNAKKAQVASGDLQKKQMSDCGVGLSTGSREKVPQKLWYRHQQLARLALDVTSNWVSTMKRIILLSSMSCKGVGWVVLATALNCQVGSRSGSTRNWTVAMVLSARNTRTVGNGVVLPPKTRHLKFTILAPIQYLSSDRITTWLIRRLCSFSRSFTSGFQICDRTSIRWVAIENPPISLKICH